MIMKFLRGLFGTSIMDVTKFKPKLPVERYDTSIEWTLESFKRERVTENYYIVTHSKIVVPTGSWKIVEWSDQFETQLYVEVFTDTGKEWIHGDQLRIIPVPIKPTSKETINQCRCGL